MFCGKKEDVKRVVEIIRKERCCYGGGGYCDCKYGYEGNGEKSWSEETGCPELMTVVELLSGMTEEEYNIVLSRNHNCLL